MPVTLSVTCFLFANNRFENARGGGIEYDGPCQAPRYANRHSGAGAAAGVPVIPVNPWQKQRYCTIKKVLEQTAGTVASNCAAKDFIDVKALARHLLQTRQHFTQLNNYTAIHHLINHENFDLDTNTQELMKVLRRK